MFALSCRNRTDRIPGCHKLCARIFLRNDLALICYLAVGRSGLLSVYVKINVFSNRIPLDVNRCIQIIDKNGDAKPMVCVQCGKCEKACPEGAITQNAKGVYMINKKKCTGCGACAKACPFGLIVKTEGNPASKCIACGICAKACPMDVLEVVDE